MYYILYQNGQILSIDNGEAPTELEEGVSLRQISQSEYNVLTNQFPNLVNNPYFALVQGAKVLSFNHAPIPENLPPDIQLIELTEENYIYYTQNFSYNYVINEDGSIIVDNIAQLKEIKIKTAIDYKINNAEKIRFVSEEFEPILISFTNQRQIELFHRANMVQKNAQIFSESECAVQNQDSVYIFELKVSINASEVLAWLYKIGCYSELVEIKLMKHIEKIQLFDNIESIEQYNIEEGYPSILEFTY